MTTKKIFILVKDEPSKELYIIDYSDYCSSLLSSQKEGKKSWNIG